MSLAVQPPVQAARTGITPTPTPAARVYLPLLFKQAKPPPPYVCPTNSANGYDSGEARQHDGDDPVRPAVAHADKNLALRGYVSNADAGLRRELVNYGTKSGSARWMTSSAEHASFWTFQSISWLHAGKPALGG